MNRSNASRHARPRHTTRRHERAIAIVLTSLVLIPLMIFAAFAVDLASWYARITDIQRAADAAALAGAVWMPDLTKASNEAAASLASNGIVNGTGGMTVQYARGATSNALRVTVTDTDAERYFSQVVNQGNQRLSRSAEAEYNLPLPLGSPLNYFGGDAARTQPAQVLVDRLQPNGTNFYSTHQPINFASTGCNVGTSSAQGFGSYNSSGNFQNSFITSGSPPRCLWRATSTAGSGTITSPPPDYNTRVPSNGTGTSGTARCKVYTGGVTTGAQIGRWENSVFTAGTGGTGTWANCSWPNFGTNVSSLIPTWSSTPPTNRPCRVGWGVSDWWNTTGTSAATTGTPNGLDTAGNRLCTWQAPFATTDETPANPIQSTRSPGFWAAVEGPQTNAYQGDAYSTRCYNSSGSTCSSVQNATYSSGADRGYWYAIRIPTGLSGSVDLRVFDASYIAGSTNVNAGDRSLDTGGNFTTRFRAYKQTNPLDFTQRTALGNSSASTTEGSCYWDLVNESSFQAQWRNLCTLSGVSAGEIYLINVQTPGTTGAGVNGYALEAVANGSYSGPQPALFALSNMEMQNNNSCTTPCTLAPSTFYLAEVGPQFAGRTLVMELWDPGDVGSGVTANMEPMRPSTTQPRPVQNVPAADCSWTSGTAPNAVLSGISGTQAATDQPSDSTSSCLIRTATSGTSRFNGTWLRIRIDIPSTYTCTVGINPETTAGSCWWGIRYTFSGGSSGSGGVLSANDVTTWQARIEGNPLQLTQ